MPKRLTFSDRDLLRNIQRLYEDQYNEKKYAEPTRYYIPICTSKVADAMNVDKEMVFQRLYFHLNKKYSYVQHDSSHVELFAFKIAGVMHCINYPYLCAILAELDEHHHLQYIPIIISGVALLVSVLAIFL